MPFSRKSLVDHLRQSCAVLLAGCFLTQQTQAAAGSPATLPTNGAYVAGSGSIKTSGNAVTVNQSTLRGIIDWRTFSVGEGGAVVFKNGNGATLNRVTGSQMSSLLGSLIASGSVYLINPQGVLIGPGAHINTGGDFVASTLNVTNNLFLAGGPLSFQGDSKNVVVNLGSIFSKDGSVFLVGHGVKNAGSIAAPNGTAGLAAGSEVLLKDSTGDQRVFVQAAGGDVVNTGDISAAQAELKAKGGNIYALAGNNGGAISANGTASIDGHAWLISDGGATQVSGTVSAQDASGKGGNVETSGHNLDISHATVKTGPGGNWLLDPVDLLIDSAAASAIQNSLATTNVTVQTSATSASGPGTQSAGNGDITVGSSIQWGSSNSLTLTAYRDVNVNNGVTIANTAAGNLTLRADNSSSGTGTINFNGTGKVDYSGSTGNVSLLYNPTNYSTPTDYTPFVTTNGSWTAPTDGSVTSQLTAYMLVNNASDVQAMGASAAALTGTYALGRDIDLASIPNFTPLAPNNGTFPAFSGILDGMGHTLDHLTIVNPTTAAGLFATIDTTGQVRNLNMTNVSISSVGGYVGFGAVAGESDGTISNVSVSGSFLLASAQSDTGGLLGDNYGTVQNAHANITMDGSAVTGGPNVGGLIGYNNGPVLRSSAAGSVLAPNANSAYIGGLIGNNDSAAVTDSSASGNVSAGIDALLGGLIGNNSGGVLSEVHATGAVSGGEGSSTGGLVGNNSGAVSNAYATGDVTADRYSTVGGLIGYSNAPISDSYATGSVTGQSRVKAGGLVGQADFGASITRSYALNNVTAADYSTVGGLAGRSGDAITTSFAAGSVSGGLGSKDGGLVGWNTGSITVSYAMGNVSATGGSSQVGGLVGYNEGDITDAYARGSVSGGTDNSSIIGGLVGYVEDTGTVTNTYASGAVASGSAYAGGLVGKNRHGIITTSYWDSQTSGLPTTGVALGDTAGVTAKTTGDLLSGAMPSGFNGSNTVWTAPGGVYPYFGWQGPLVAIAGHFYASIFNPTPIVSANVNAMSGGVVIGSQATDAYGVYEIDVPQNMTRFGQGVLTYATGTPAANTYSDGNNSSGFRNMNLYSNTLTILNDNHSTMSGLAAALGQTLGNNSGGNFLYSTPNGLLTVTNGTNFLLGNSVYSPNPAPFTIDQNLSGLGTTYVQSPGGLTLGTGASLTANSGKSIYLLAGASFTNNAGANALQVSNGGRWLVYSTNPLNDNRGGLAYSFKQYNATFGTSVAQATGNGFLYSVAPVLSATLSGSTVKTYDGTTNVTGTQPTLTANGVIDGDSVSLTASSYTYDNKNAGNGKTVTANNVTFGSATNGSVRVYGYTVAPGVVAANIGTINKKTISGTVNANSKTYDGTLTTTGSAGPLTGVIAGDQVSLDTASATFNFSDKNAGTNKTVAVSGVTLDGSDAGNYQLSSTVSNSTANITPATLTVGGTTFAAGKTYDGSTKATVSGGNISGLIGNDTVNFSQSGVFGDKNAGTGKTVTYTNSISGADAGNYVLSLNGGTLTANIDPATLVYTVTSVGSTRGFGTANPVFTGTVTGLVGGDTLASVTSGSPAFTTNATVASGAGTYAVIGGGLTLTSPNYTFVQAAGNANAFTIKPITIAIGNSTKTSGSANPTFTVTYSGTESDYLKSVLAGLKLVTNAPASDTPGTYQITALLPASLAGSIVVEPGTLVINAGNNYTNVLVNNGSPQVIASLPAAFNSQAPKPPQPLPSVSGSVSAMDSFVPGNAVSHFQVVITPTQGWAEALGLTNGQAGADANLSSASFTETSPDGRTQDNKSTYAAGAQK